MINITGHHVELTPALRDYVTEKLARLNHHVDHITAMHVILTVEKRDHKATGNIQLRGSTLHAECISEDMYAAIDLLSDKLNQQAIKYKEKQRSHHGDGKELEAE